MNHEEAVSGPATCVRIAVSTDDTRGPRAHARRNSFAHSDWEIIGQETESLDDPIAERYQGIRPAPLGHGEEGKLYVRLGLG